MVISLTSVSAAPWGEELLSGIDFQLERGQVLGILGPNGAGKTSLLNVLCGSVHLSSGELRLGDKALTDWPVRARACAQAVLPQQSSLNFPYTVEEVILLGRTPHSSGSAVDAQILNETLKATDTDDLRHRIYTQLSGGEKQRVQLARVFAQLWRPQDSDVRVLLLDEPTSALDLSHQQLIMASIRELAAQGCAVAMVLHDFNLAARYTDLCLVLHQGQQQVCGTPSDVLTPEMFRRVFDVEVTVTEHPAGGLPLVIQS